MATNCIHLATTLIKRHEGLRLKPYRCTAGKTTIGYGRNLDDNGISKEEATLMMSKDIMTCEQVLDRTFSWFEELSEPRKSVLIDMAYNLGMPRLFHFKKMLSALEKGDYEEAVIQMLDSRWANQVGNRAITLANIMSDG